MIRSTISQSTCPFREAFEIVQIGEDGVSFPNYFGVWVWVLEVSRCLNKGRLTSRLEAEGELNPGLNMFEENWESSGDETAKDPINVSLSNVQSST